MIRIDVHLHSDGSSATADALLADIIHRLKTIERQGDRLMAVTQDVKDAMVRIDTATNAIAARIQALIDKVGTGMTQADVDAVTAGLQAEATKLEGLGADPANPVPVV